MTVKLERRIPDLRSSYDHFIDGRSVRPASGEYYWDINPVTGDRLAEVALGSQADVSLAVASAHSAFDAWRLIPAARRSRLLNDVSRAIRDSSTMLIDLEILDTGEPLAFARGDVETCARYFEFYGGIADKINGDTIPLDAEHLIYTIREPFGVSGQIVPWNGPIIGAARGVAPALAAGNTVVLKPASQTSLTTLEVARIAREAGLPDGVLNVVTGPGAIVGACLVDSTQVRQITFTGSAEAGMEVLRRAANRIVPVAMELGGKSPNVVFHDAPFDAAVEGIITAFTMNTGQICSAGSRLLVERTVRDDFVAAVVARAKDIKVGRAGQVDGLGPLISETQLSTVLRYLDIARDEGATVAAGGHRVGDKGYFVQPTVLVDVQPHMRVFQEEIFGPVLTVTTFDDEEEAIQLANGTEFGLAAAVWTLDIRRAHRMAARLDAGQVYINQYFDRGVETPFGGFKRSGFGRVKGIEAIKAYTQVKSVSVSVA